VLLLIDREIRVKEEEKRGDEGEQGEIFVTRWVTKRFCLLAELEMEIENFLDNRPVESL
jgi:hypothetical protein